MSSPSIDDPSNWVEASDPATGRSYWINKSTNETSWKEDTAGDGHEWEELLDKGTGRNYFVNRTSRRATWSRPELNELANIERYFRYIDKRGKEQGPFPESKMQEWYGEGYFKAEVKCREETEREWSTIGNFFDDDQEDEEVEEEQTRTSTLGLSSKSHARRSSVIISPEGDVVESKVSSLRDEINILNSEIGGTFRMTQIAQQKSNENTTTTKKGSLYVKEKGMISSSFYERFVVLEGNKLSWFDDKDHTDKARGSFILNPSSKATPYSEADEDDFKGFRVTGEASEDLILQAPRYMAMKAWNNAIQKSVNELTGKTHTELLETMTDSALGQITKLQRLQTELQKVVTQKIHEQQEQHFVQTLQRKASRGSIEDSTDVMSTILNHANLLGIDIKDWGEQSQTQLASQVNVIKTMSRKQSTHELTLGKKIEGYLTKRAMSGKNSWKKRYFVVSPTGTKDQPFVTIKYMAKPGSATKGVISLSAHTTVEKKNAKDVKGKENVFEVNEGGETLCVQTTTEKERDEWIDAIKICVQLFMAATTASTSKTSDHFGALLQHMNVARSICQRLLKLTEEYNEAEKEESVKRQVSFFFFLSVLVPTCINMSIFIWLNVYLNFLILSFFFVLSPFPLSFLTSLFYI